jgi:hypothetical protein
MLVFLLKVKRLFVHRAFREGKTLIVTLTQKGVDLFRTVVANPAHAE